LAGAVFEFTLK